MSNMDLTKSMAQLIHDHPEVAKALSELEIDCADCLAAEVDKLPDVVRMYNLNFKKLLSRIEVLANGS